MKPDIQDITTISGDTIVTFETKEKASAWIAEHGNELMRPVKESITMKPGKFYYTVGINDGRRNKKGRIRCEWTMTDKMQRRYEKDTSAENNGVNKNDLS